MTKQEILEKVEAKEFKHRCLNLDICPKCGGDLDPRINDEGSVDKVCDDCGMLYWT